MTTTTLAAVDYRPTVTGNPAFDIRNARLIARCRDGNIWGVRCGRCCASITAVGDVADSPKNLRPFAYHCCTCGTTHGDHGCCHGCGACLPPRYGGLWQGERWFGRSHRRDSFYCSNACRQRAYRWRKA